VTMLPTPLIRKEPPSTRITHVPAGTFRRRRDGGVCMAAVHAVDTVQVRDHPQLPRVVKSRRGYPIYSLLSNTLRYQLSRARPTPSQHSLPHGSARLHELTKLAPVAILAEALGCHPTTIERHAVDSATVYARYVSAIRTD